MALMRDGSEVEDRRLGRLVPTDWRHVERYSIAALSRAEQPTDVPVVIGINWYEAFDRPVARRERGHTVYAVGEDGKLGRVRGGHCVVLEPKSRRDTPRWYQRMDQGNEGACVGFGSTRCMMLLNRRQYDAFWLYHEAQKVDEWEGENYDGTSVRAAMDVLRERGHRRISAGKTLPEDKAEGIAANRWAQSVDEVLHALGTPGLDHVTFLNSWGTSYPHRVRMPGEVLERLLVTEDGEVAIPVDR
jgi:hypothetical protein